MGQVTIYLDDETEEKMRGEAEAMHLSKSKWIARLIQERLSDQWPANIRNIAGSWRDFPDRDKIGASSGSDIPRESF
jgi:hypothetical protein